MVRICCVVLVAACGFDHGSPTSDRQDAAPDDDSGADALVDGSMIDAAIDAPVTTACTGTGLACNGSVVATTCNGACWVKCTSSSPIASQSSAANACTNWGGKLAPLRSAEDHACVVATLFPAQAHWIGFEQSTGATTVTALWSWNSDGIMPTVTFWGGGQPNDLNGNENDHAEQCAFVNTAGDWHDELCSNGGLYRFSCRR